MSKNAIGLRINNLLSWNVQHFSLDINNIHSSLHLIKSIERILKYYYIINGKIYIQKYNGSFVLFIPIFYGINNAYLKKIKYFINMYLTCLGIKNIIYLVKSKNILYDSKMLLNYIKFKVYYVFSEFKNKASSIKFKQKLKKNKNLINKFNIFMIKNILKRYSNINSQTGIMISISGKIRGVSMAKTQKIIINRLKLNTLKSRICYTKSTILNKHGVTGLKCWINIKNVK